jgi:type II secretory pathway component PulM
MRSIKNITYKRKNKILLWGGSLLFVVIYQFTFKNTIALYSECREMKKRSEMQEGAAMKKAKLEKEAARLDLLSGSMQANDSNVQQALLGIVTSYCQSNGLLLKEFPQTQRSQENNYQIELNNFTVEGEFQKLIKLVYCLEQRYRIGKVASLDFRAKKDLRTKRTSLAATVYLQNIKRT